MLPNQRSAGLVFLEVQDFRVIQESPQGQDVTTTAKVRGTRKNKLLFAAIPEEPYFEENKRVFSQNVSVNNSFDYHLFIDGADVCTGGHQVFLLIIIPSTHGDWQERNAIRRTWLGAGERDLWPLRKVGVPVRHIFLLGLQTDVDVNMLQAESLQHGDLVLAGFVDSYRNLTTKMLVGLQWVQNYCPQAQIVLKVDQDTLINMPLIVALLWHVRERAGGDNAAFVLGLKHFHPKPVVKRTGKWRVSESEYPLPYFPAYVYGHTYALSSPSGVSRLLQAAHHVPLIAPEDAFITGVLPKVAGMVRLTSKAFTVCCRRFISRCEVVLNERVAFTSLDSGYHLDNLWTDIMRHECDPLRYERS
ncbi:beta-1,3-galactosyltransferase 1 [Plakobranchus ocellatus]|uniref:Hexosyltransferase n=1 Tax=Plakobranchus ocellatus TaxID=259542 RepID=A0AAV3Y7K0_9GAST|nr:beta-1,3-galactosyltransferase 1 [Plakobranchus ocellatus]